MMITFSKRLRDLMSRKRWQQIDVSRKCKIDPGTVSGYLSGKRRPRPDVLLRIATAFGITLEAFTNGVDPATLGRDDTMVFADAVFSADRAEAARQARGKSIRSLATHHSDPEKAIYSGMYHKWLNGSSRPSQRKLGCLAEALEVPVAWLLGEGPDEVPDASPSTATPPTATPRKPAEPAALATEMLDNVLVVVPRPNLERLQAMARIGAMPITIATAKEALDYALATESTLLTNFEKRRCKSFERAVGVSAAQVIRPTFQRPIPRMAWMKADSAQQ